MKKVLPIVLITFLAVTGFAQSFKSLRYDENYAHLKESTKLNWYERMKFTPLSASGNHYLSLGGEVRY